MSLDLYENETSDLLSRLAPVKNPEAGAFDGFFRGAGQSAMQTFAKTGRAAGMAIGGVVGASEKAAEFATGKVDTTLSDSYFKAHDETLQRAVDYWTPDSNEVGTAGQVVGQLLATLPMVIASPLATVAGTELATAEDLSRKGVDTTRAVAVGGVQAAGLGLGVWLPILGNNLWQRVVVGGMGANAAQGIATRGASEAILQGTPAAKDFEAFDGSALTLDVLLGAAFGGLAHLSPAQRAQGKEVWDRIEAWGKTLKPSDVDAIAGLRQAQHLNVDSMPGNPVGTGDIDAHVTRMRTAIDQLARDEPVNVSDLPAARVEPDPVRQAESEARGRELVGEAERVRVEEGLPEPVASPGVEAGGVKSLSTEDLKVQMQYLRIADENLAAGRPSVTPEAPVEVRYNVDTGEYSLVDGYHRYLALRGGSIDAALENAKAGKFPDILSDVTLVKNETDGSGFVTERQLTAEEAAARRAGPAARAPLDVAALQDRLTQAHPDVETRLHEHENGTLELDLIEVKDEANKGRGLAPAAMRDLLKTADEHGRGVLLLASPLNPDRMPLPKLEKWYEQFGFKKQETEYSNATYMYRDPRGAASADRSEGAPGSIEARAGTHPEGQEERSQEVDPIAAEAQRVAAERPDLEITVGQDPDGKPIRQNVADYLAETRETVARAQDDIKLLQEAASCMMGVG